jgi:hypothetical protein
MRCVGIIVTVLYYSARNLNAVIFALCPRNLERGCSASWQ